MPSIGSGKYILMFMRTLFCLTLLFAIPAAAAPATNVILVTADGLRWQEVFRGADDQLLKDERFTPKDYAAFPAHQSAGRELARQRLMPFLWDTVAQQGALLGNRDQSNFMRVTNPWWFSYPGYNEILTGRPDPAIDSNAKRPNANTTVLEWLNRQPAFKDKVLAFGSWDVFPDIINAARSGIAVNAGFMTAADNPTGREAWLNGLQAQIPSPWPTVRFDAFTHNFALEALRSRKPRVVYIAYGETDDFAHEGKYAQYLDAAHRFDGFLRELWQTIQEDAHYRNQTVLLVTTDHGRGELPLETWQHHASPQAVRGYVKSLAQYEAGIVGSDQIWFAALGAGIAPKGNMAASTGEHTQSQLAATALRALGLAREDFDADAGEALNEIFVDE